MSKAAPYSTWESPITADALIDSSTSIADIFVDPLTYEVYHVEGRPSEEGRNILVHTKTGRDVVGKGWNVRTGVQEYGGAAAIVRGGVAYFSNYNDGRVYSVLATSINDPQPVTPECKVHRFADFELYSTLPHLLVSILEDHTRDIPSEVVTTLCVINTTTKEVTNLVTGADFYSSPRFSPDGSKLAWLQWFHPDMPWEGSELYVADVEVLNGKIVLSNHIYVAGEKLNISVAYPYWLTNDVLLFTNDQSGYQNPWKFTKGKASPVFKEPVSEDFGEPAWMLGWCPYARMDNIGNAVLCTAIQGGRSVLYLIDLESGAKPYQLDCPYVGIDSMCPVAAGSPQAVFTSPKTDEKGSIVLCELSSSSAPAQPTYTVLKALSTASTFPSGIIAKPQPITLKVPPNDEPLHVIYYPPTNPDYSGSSIPGEKPPCVVNVHGGPTALEGQGLNWKKQYFTSRGWAWLDVNYGGSSGYGRKYITRLAGKWGIVDVEDCIHAIRILATNPYNLLDPARVAIRGGSAGGYTTLAAMSISSDVTAFSAGTSSYGISNLKLLVADAHKFESKYLEKLIGATVEQDLQRYEDRSPYLHASKIASPLLILQGELDKVVPKEQAEEMVKVIQDHHGDVEYQLYAGEGHGWRQASTIKDALERELAFYNSRFKLSIPKSKV